MFVPVKGYEPETGDDAICADGTGDAVVGSACSACAARGSLAVWFWFAVDAGVDSFGGVMFLGDSGVVLIMDSSLSRRWAIVLLFVDGFFLALRADAKTQFSPWQTHCVHGWPPSPVGIIC